MAGLSQIIFGFLATDSLLRITSFFVNGDAQYPSLRAALVDNEHQAIAVHVAADETDPTARIMIDMGGWEIKAGCAPDTILVVADEVLCGPETHSFSGGRSKKGRIAPAFCSLFA
jgi:hypothetical protein